MPNISPHTKLHPNRVKNTKLKDFVIGRFGLVALVGQKIAVTISNSFYIPLLISDIRIKERLKERGKEREKG